MPSILTIILSGLVLCVLLVAAGVAIGRSLPAATKPSGKDKRGDRGRFRNFGRRLGRLAHSVADDVGRYQHEIEQACRELAAVHNSADTPHAQAVLETLAQIARNNEHLRGRLAAAEEKIEHQACEIESHFNDARSDPLTGLLNRRAFDDELGRRFAEWQRKKAPFSLVMADLDRFKALNDRYGHPAGDAVLRKIAEVFQVTVRDMDVVARLGGEELAVILPGAAARDARRVAERIRAAAAATAVPVEGLDLCVTASLGLATVAEGDDSASLLRRADEALYAAKHLGRNCACFHDGRHAERICIERRTADPAEPDGEIKILCEDLRSRLGEVIP